MASDLQKQKLKGKVKSIKSLSWDNIFRDKDGNFIGGKLTHYGNGLRKFNESGNLQEEIDYNDTRSTPSSTEKYKYDNKGNLIEIDLDILKYIESYSYDYMDRVNEIIKKGYNGNTLEVTKYHYNSDSSIRRINIHYIHGNLLNEQCFIYDERGNVIINESYNNNILEYKCIKRYNTNNHKTKQVVFQIDESHKSFFGLLSFPFIYEKIPTFSSIYKYDCKGNVNEAIHIGKIWTIIDYFIPFNISQLFIRFLSKKQYKYDDKENLIKEVWLNVYKYRSLDTFHNTYTYDAEGNWIQKTSFGESNTMNREGGSMEERIIEYY